MAQTLVSLKSKDVITTNSTEFQDIIGNCFENEYHEKLVQTEPIELLNSHYYQIKL